MSRFTPPEKIATLQNARRQSLSPAAMAGWVLEAVWSVVRAMSWISP
jgi:hypothetical protein